MRKTVVPLAVMAALASATVVSAAHKPNVPLPSNVLLISPLSVKAHNLFTLTGRKFPANEKMPVQMFCPQWGKKTNGYDHWTVRSNASGGFVQKHRALQPKNTKNATCSVYILVKSHGRAFYVSSQVRIKS